MANNDWDDFEDDDSGDGSDLVKKLRSQLKAANKRAAELESAQAELSKKVRTTSVKEILNGAGVTPKIARFVLADVEDPTEESVNEWLKENGDLFGITAGGSSGDSQESAGQSVADLQALNQINQFTAENEPSGSSKVEELAGQIESAGSVEELMKILGKG